MDFIEAGLANLQIPGLTIRDLPGDVEEMITAEIDKDTIHMRLNPVQMNILRDEARDLRNELRMEEDRYYSLEDRFHHTTEAERAWMREFESKEQDMAKINLKIRQAKTALHFRNLRVQAGIRI